MEEYVTYSRSSPESRPESRGWFTVNQPYFRSAQLNPVSNLFAINVCAQATFIIDLKKRLAVEQREAIHDFSKRVANKLALTHEDFGICGLCEQSIAHIPVRTFYRKVIKFLGQFS